MGLLNEQSVESVRLDLLAAMRRALDRGESLSPAYTLAVKQANAQALAALPKGG